MINFPFVINGKLVIKGAPIHNHIPVIYLYFFSGLKPKINILDILKPAEEVESNGLDQSDCK